jgi:hypothetical protein
VIVVVKRIKTKLAIIEKDGLRTVGMSLVRFKKASPPLQLGAEGFAAPYFIVFVWSHALWIFIEFIRYVFMPNFRYFGWWSCGVQLAPHHRRAGGLERPSERA